MDISFILVFLLILINCVSGGVGLPHPEDLKVNITDGEVIVLWKKPAGSPPNSEFNVEMKRHTGWSRVDSCTRITDTYCVLGGLIADHRVGYKARVQMVAGDDVSQWKIKSFLPSESELQPPVFDLWATSSSLTVTVYPKPILRELFPYGITYTIYLEETGHDKITTVYLKDDMGDDKKTMTFTSLHLERQYCVSIRVEGNGANTYSKVSLKRCMQLPEQEWFITAVSSLSALGVLAFVAIIALSLLCYLKRPTKTPAVLKSPATGWRPLSVGEGPMEVVTDKGWFLSSKRTEGICVKDPATHVMTVEENDGEEERRTSMDSGVDMESNSAPNSNGNPPMRQEDSGCGSLGGPESSTGSQKDFHLLQEDRTGADTGRKREDSGVGLGCQLHSSSMNLIVQDSGSLEEVVVGGNYRRQSPSAVQKHTCETEEELKLPDSTLAEVVTGYRATAQACICSGAGHCAWCHKQGLYGATVIKQYRTTCMDKSLLSGKQDFVDSYKGITLSSYPQTAQMDKMRGFETTILQLGGAFPSLTAFTPLSLVEGGQDFNMNNVSLSLCDVQLTAD